MQALAVKDAAQGNSRVAAGGDDKVALSMEADKYADDETAVSEQVHASEKIIINIIVPLREGPPSSIL